MKCLNCLKPVDLDEKRMGKDNSFRCDNCKAGNFAKFCNEKIYTGFVFVRVKTDEGEIVFGQCNNSACPAHYVYLPLASASEKLISSNIICCPVCDNPDRRTANILS